MRSRHPGRVKRAPTDETERSVGIIGCDQDLLNETDELNEIISANSAQSLEVDDSFFPLGLRPESQRVITVRTIRGRLQNAEFGVACV